MASAEAMADLATRLQAFEAQMVAQAASHAERLATGEQRIQQFTLELAGEREGRATLLGQRMGGVARFANHCFCQTVRGTGCDAPRYTAPKGEDHGSLRCCLEL